MKILGRKTIRISCLGTPSDYHNGLLPIIIQKLGYRIEWVSPFRANLVIYGPFYDPKARRLRWMPRAWRGGAGNFIDTLGQELAKRSSPPLTLFHTGENRRYDQLKTDFAISHDLNAPLESHYRLPYWMEVVDWSHEGIDGNSNPRYGDLLYLKKLMEPLGNQFLKRKQNAVLITSHLNELRASCYKSLQKIITVDGFGPYFNRAIKNHHKSNFLKKDILGRYSFNLCPENSSYPGYVTEKIPEAFASGCLPIGFVDPSVNVDFNELSFVNLKKYYNKGNVDLPDDLLSKEIISRFIDQPLIIKKPEIKPFINFIEKIVGIAKN